MSWSEWKKFSGGYEKVEIDSQQGEIQLGFTPHFVKIHYYNSMNRWLFYIDGIGYGYYEDGGQKLFDFNNSGHGTISISDNVVTYNVSYAFVDSAVVEIFGV